VLRARSAKSKSDKDDYGKLSAQGLGRKQIMRGASKNIPDFCRFALGLLLGHGAAEYLRLGFYLGAPGHNI
jgi:hypothetical protein